VVDKGSEQSPLAFLLIFSLPLFRLGSDIQHWLGNCSTLVAKRHWLF
jgi:hypothetical protein